MKVDLIIIYRESDRYSLQWMWVFAEAHVRLKSLTMGFTSDINELIQQVRAKIAVEGYTVNVAVVHRNGIEQAVYPEFWDPARIIPASMMVIDDVMDDAGFAMVRLAMS